MWSGCSHSAKLSAIFTVPQTNRWKSYELSTSIFTHCPKFKQRMCVFPLDKLEKVLSYLKGTMIEHVWYPGLGRLIISSELMLLLGWILFQQTSDHGLGASRQRGWSPVSKNKCVTSRTQLTTGADVRANCGLKFGLFLARPEEQRRICICSL